MKFLTKIENAINFILIKLGELMFKAVPTPIKNFFGKFNLLLIWIGNNFKRFPTLFMTFASAFIVRVKSFIANINLRAVADKTLQTAKVTTPKGVSKFKSVLMLPFTVLGTWLNGLSAGQAIMLLTFSSVSILAVIGIGFSGQKIMMAQSELSRSPASLQENAEYDRPAYYKKDERHLALTNFRLPIYIPKVNEIRSVDIDFIATISNRFARGYLEKHEFHLRDHLILQIEPSVASFPVQDEGKEILRLKLMKEINDFLKLNKVEGHVLEVKITYILAN